MDGSSSEQSEAARAPTLLALPLPGPTTRQAHPHLPVQEANGTQWDGQKGVLIFCAMGEALGSKVLTCPGRSLFCFSFNIY